MFWPDRNICLKNCISVKKLCNILSFLLSVFFVDLMQSLFFFPLEKCFITREFVLIWFRNLSKRSSSFSIALLIWFGKKIWKESFNSTTARTSNLVVTCRILVTCYSVLSSKSSHFFLGRKEKRAILFKSPKSIFK